MPGRLTVENLCITSGSEGRLVGMAHSHAPEWVGSIGTVMVLVRAGSETAAREKVAELVNRRARQRGLLFDASEVQVRRAKAADLLVFSEAGLTALDRVA